MDNSSFRRSWGDQSLQNHRKKLITALIHRQLNINKTLSSTKTAATPATPAAPIIDVCQTNGNEEMMEFLLFSRVFHLSLLNLLFPARWFVIFSDALLLNAWLTDGRHRASPVVAAVDGILMHCCNHRRLSIATVFRCCCFFHFFIQLSLTHVPSRY